MENPWTAQERVYADTLAQAEYAEALGFDAGWLAEHHFAVVDGLTAALALVGAALVFGTRLHSAWLTAGGAAIGLLYRALP